MNGKESQPCACYSRRRHDDTPVLGQVQVTTSIIVICQAFASFSTPRSSANDMIALAYQFTVTTVTNVYRRRDRRVII